MDIHALYHDIYTQGRLFGVDRRFALYQPPTGSRPNSIAIEGGAFGDEGKGKIVDELCTILRKTHGALTIYRWNGGANAGHTIIVGDRKIALHQLPSGALTPGATVILGKGMVLHPGDLVTEIDSVRQLLGGEFPARLLIDEQAVLSLDTHRAFEGAIKVWQGGGAGSTGRGISPAYADVLYRHPVRVRDLVASDWAETLGTHYDFYAAWTRGLGAELATYEVPALQHGPSEVGTRDEFLEKLASKREILVRYTGDVYSLVQATWRDATIPFVFEGAQAVGLDARYGIYPDITASDPTFHGILHSTEGVVDPAQIAIRAATIKATYTSSVGIRRLPTVMEPVLAQRIREDANEYGSTTKRPRDIACIDLPCLRFYARVSGATHLVLTHLDIAYPDTPIRVCLKYADDLPYRPDQRYLDTVQPQYVELPSWDGAAVTAVDTVEGLPTAAHQYIALLTQALATPPLYATNGPARHAILSWVTP